METFFIRHTHILDIIPKDIKELIYSDNRIAIHFDNINSINENDYSSKTAKSCIRRFNELARSGGYIWADYYNPKNSVLIGKINPNSNVKIIKSKTKDNKIAFLKTIKLSEESVTKLKPHEAMCLRACRPRQGTFCRWQSGNNKRLISLIEKIDLLPEWENLSPSQQEIACVEYLRFKHNNNLPVLKHLLLPPGRTLKDIDIYAVAEDDKEILSQVTFYDKEKAKWKYERLSDYNAKNLHLLFICSCDIIHTENNIIFLPYREILDWLKSQKILADKFFKI